MAAFTQGDIVVYRVGDGSASLDNIATAAFLDEYTTGGAFVQTIALPTADNGSQHALTASGSAAAEGLLTTSTDGRYLVLAGYDTTPGTATVASTSAISVPRTVGRVDASGNIDTTTALTDFASGSGPRGVASDDGSSFYLTGGAGGVRYATFGATTSTQLSTTTTNLRAVGIYNGQLYVTSASNGTRIATVGAGEPTTSGQTITNLPGIGQPNISSPYGFYFADLSPTVAGDDTLYITDAANGIDKFSLVGDSWTFNGTAGSAATAGYTGLTASVTGTTVTVFATNTGSIVTITDASGYNGSFSGTPNQIATAGSNKAFRGVAFAPACFASGTLIRTARGDVAVEQLAVGDVAITRDGRRQPIIWLGHQTLDCRRHPRPGEAMPIRIAAHAFAPNRPARDLLVSPGHAICVDVIGEVLMPAAALVNGGTIRQIDVETVTYWHVELDDHDIILAENLPTESYIDAGNRAFFVEVGSAAPDGSDAPASETEVDRRPIHYGDALVDLAQARLSRAGAATADVRAASA